MNSSAFNASADTSLVMPETLDWCGKAPEYSSITLTEDEINKCLDYVKSFQNTELFGSVDNSEKAAQLPKSVKLANVLNWKNDNESVKPSKFDVTLCIEVLCQAPRVVTYPELCEIFEKLPLTYRQLIDPLELFERCITATDDLGRLLMTDVRDFLFELASVINHWRLLQEFSTVKPGWITEKELKSFFHHMIQSNELYEDIRVSPHAVYVAEAYTSLVCLRFGIVANGCIEIKKLLCTRIIPIAFGAQSDIDFDVDCVFFSKNCVIESMDLYMLRSVDGNGYTLEDLCSLNPDILMVFFSRYIDVFGQNRLYFLENYRLVYVLETVKSGKPLVSALIKHLFTVIDIDNDGWFSKQDCAFFHFKMFDAVFQIIDVQLPLDDYYDSLFDLAHVGVNEKLTLQNLLNPVVDTAQFFSMLFDVSYVCNQEQSGSVESESE